MVHIDLSSEEGPELGVTCRTFFWGKTWCQGHVGSSSGSLDWQCALEGFVFSLYVLFCG